MSGRAHLSLGGQVVDLRPGQTHAWSLTASTGPHVGQFVAHKSIVDKIAEKATAQFRKIDPRKTRVGGSPQGIGPLTLEIDGGPGKPVKIKGLYMIARLAGDDHINNEVIVVADRRWLWRTLPVKRRYNVRRPTPEKRWVDGELVPLQVARTVADLTHERMTLFGLERPWTAAEVLKDVLSYLCGSNGFVLDLKSVRLQGVVQDMRLRDQGPAALQRVLSQVPGIMTYAHPDGKIHLRDAFDRSEQVVFAKFAKTPISGSWRVQDRSLSIPKQVLVGFEREHEIRFDYEERDTTVLTSRPKQKKGREEPTLENVAPIPDPNLTVNGTKLAMGSYAEILSGLLPAWAADDKQPGNGIKLTQAKLLRFSLSGLGPLYATYRRVPGAPDALFARRLGKLQEHYRRTFKISQQWMDKLQFVAARRSSIVDQEHGTRGRSDAFFDYVVRPSNLDLASRGQTSLGTQIIGFATQIKDGAPAPGEVSIDDPLSGIIKVTPRVDLNGADMIVTHGQLDAPFPQADAAKRASLWARVSLKASWKLAVILTGVPSVPNDERSLWWVAVSLGDAAKKLGAPTPKALGPDRAILSGDSVARFAWVDSLASEIKESIWTGTPPPAGALTNPQEIEDVARAQAARVVSPLLPRVVGKVSIPLEGAVVPTGSLKTVTHGISLDGAGRARAWTQLNAPAASVPPPNSESLWTERTRKIVSRLIVLGD